jgi:hypothetical protein
MTATAARRDRTTAVEYVERLYANGNAYHTRAIDYAEWSRRQFAAWDAITARGARFADTVHALLRTY